MVTSLLILAAHVALLVGAMPSQDIRPDPTLTTIKVSGTAPSSQADAQANKGEAR
ncbi:hypothetical protein [Labrys wisconsinensis]|uniref:Energy transducer TonB n=1 Tax=Labrys wisconsinensis TaxID=425677 RepID=A0ABU0JLT7_9HYPH|nr:hypothetical protein [Labrys wisconsinensis]MDQ0475256.1 hypothetical protein [Labrys wisconsinensis]